EQRDGRHHNVGGPLPARNRTAKKTAGRIFAKNRTPFRLAVEPRSGRSLNRHGTGISRFSGRPTAWICIDRARGRDRQPAADVLSERVCFVRRSVRQEHSYALVEPSHLVDLTFPAAEDANQFFDNLRVRRFEDQERELVFVPVRASPLAPEQFVKFFARLNLVHPSTYASVLALLL